MNEINTIITNNEMSNDKTHDTSNDNINEDTKNNIKKVDKQKKDINRIDNQLKYINIYDSNHYISNCNINTTASENDIDSFLEKERNTNLNEPWNKLNKTDKLSKMKTFSKSYVSKENMNIEYEEKLYKFLKTSLENKRIQKVKDIVYDKSNGVIIEVCGLKFINEVGRFYLSKPGDQHVSTSKNLGPQKKKSKKNTLKNSPINK